MIISMYYYAWGCGHCLCSSAHFIWPTLVGISFCPQDVVDLRFQVGLSHIQQLLDVSS